MIGVLRIDENMNDRYFLRIKKSDANVTCQSFFGKTYVVWPDHPVIHCKFLIIANDPEVQTGAVRHL